MKMVALQLILVLLVQAAIGAKAEDSVDDDLVEDLSHRASGRPSVIRNRRQVSDVEFTLAEIKTAADYDNMCYTCDAILVGVGTSLQKYNTYETVYIETAIKVTKNYFGPKIEYLVAAGIMKIRSGKTALETVDFSVFGAEASVHASSTSAEAGAKIVLAGGSVSIFELQLGVGVTTGAGIMDDSVVVKVAGTGFSIGRKTGVCVFDNCFSVDFGKLFG